MKQLEQEQLLNDVEQKVGMVKTFYKERQGASELIESYEECRKGEVSTMEVKLLLEDLNLFLETEKDIVSHG